MKKAKKVLSMLLALTLLLTSVQMPVFAAQTDGEMTEARAPEADKAEASFDEDAAAPDPASNAAAAETEDTAATNAANADAGMPAEAFAGAESVASAAADNDPALEQPAFAGENAAEESADADAGAETSDEEAANANAGAETSDEAAAETAAGVSLLEDEQWLEAGILNADLSLEGNYVFREGTLDLNGHTLTISGSLLHAGGDLLVNKGTLLVTGDYRIQNRKDDGSYEGCNGALIMIHEEDQVTIGGDFYASGNWRYFDSQADKWQDYMLTAGTLTIGKGLHQCYRGDSLRAKDAHKTVFAGAGEGKTCEVSFENPDSYLGIVEMAEGAAISWTGVLNVETLGNDVAVTAPQGDGEGIELYSKNARMKYNGHALTVNGNVKNLVGQMYVGGAALAGESFDAAKAGSLTLNGDFLQQDGVLVADGGRVHVTGDWRIQHRKDDGTYEGCNAALVMTHEADDVSVDGDFYVSGDWHYQDSLTGEWVDYMLTAGTLTLNGGFCQKYRGDAFRATGTHKTVFSGKGAVSAQFESRDSYFANLELTKAPENCFFNRVPCWSKATYDGRELSAEDFPFTAVYEPDSGRLTLTGWKDTSAEIEIPAAIAGVPVTGLGGEIFKDRTDLVKITLPASLETITDGAFWGCTGLTAVSLPAAVKEIGRDAFRDCTGLVIDSLPTGLKTIGESAFRNCAALCEAVLPDTLETIGTDAFRDCASLAAIFVPASVTALGNGAFQNCQSLAEAAFAKETKLTELPERIFSGCVSLPGFELPASITRTGYESFRDCKAFTEFTVPKTVTELGTSTFLFCENLAAVNFEAGSGLKTIGESAFEGCTALTEIRIPDGTENIGRSAFYRCKGLKKAVVPATVTTMGTQAFRETALGTAGPLGSGADYEFGWTDEIPDYGFDFITSLRTAVLPDSVRSIGRYAFSECHGLTEVQLPQGLTSLGSAAFNSCESLEYITIPAGVTVLPQEIFRKCGSLVDVELSGSLTEIGRSAFEACDSLVFLELPDNVETIRRNAFWDCRNLEQVIIPESVTEFEDDIFNKKEKLTLCVFPGSAALDYAVEKEIPYTFVTELGHSLTAKVAGAEGEALASGFTVSWYDAESDALLGTGAKLRNVEKGAKILCRVVLGESLGSVYVQPDYKTAEMGDQDMTVDFALKAFGTAVIRGVVRDTEGNALSGVPVTLTQTFNGIYEKTLSAVTSKSGSFAFNAAGRTGSFVTVGADGYFEQTVAVSDTELAEGEADVRVTLEKIPENKVTLELLVREAAEDGAEPETAELAGAANLVITVYNETEGRDVPDFRIQYPNLVLGEKAAKAGDVLRLSLVSGGTLTAEDVTLTLDENRCGSVSWTFVRNGSVKLTNVKQISGGKSGVSVMVFDADGKCAESGQTAAGGYVTGALPEGTFTFVLMEKTSLLRSVDSYGKLAEFGLNPDTDFAAFDAEVKNGKIRVIDGAEVPAFDESKLYYTLKDSTRVWANVSRTTTGQYVTVRAQYEIDPKHTSTQETLLLEIPAGMTFVEKSLTLNSRASLCTVTANADGTTSVSVPVNAAKGTARFYVLPNAGGLHKVHAYLSFKTGGALVTQPLGAASVETAKATLRVPSQTSQKKITATGTAIAGCEITVYDNGTAVGTLTAKKSGTWSLTFDLVKPGKCTVHEIYALVESADYGHIETDPARVLFNRKYSELSKVTMINTAHTSTTCEFRTVFDFLNPATAVPSYNYWPAYPTFTFLVEFTGNAAAMEEVEVVTTNAAGDKTLVPCSYDPKSGKWIGVHNYLSFEQVPCRVGVYSANLSGSEPDMSVDPEEMVSILKKAKEMEDPLVAKVSELASVENPAFGSENVSFDLKLGEDKIGVYSVEMLDYEDFDLSMLSDKAYVEYIDENEQLSYQWQEITEDSFITYYAYTTDRLYGRETLRFVLPEDWVLDDEDLAGASAEVLAGAKRPLEELFGNLLSEESEPAAEEASAGFSFDSLGGMFKRLKIIQKYAGAFRTILGWVSNYEAYEEITEGFAKLGPYVEALNNTLDFLRQTINRKKCPCEGAADSWKSVENMYNSLKKEIENYKIKAYVLMGGSLAANILMQYAGGQAVKFAGKGGMAGVKALYKYVCQRFGKQVMTGARTVFVQGTRALGEGVGAYADSKFGNLSSFIHSLFDIRGHIEDGYRRIDQSIRTWIGAANTTYCPCILKTGVCECNHANPEVPDQPAEPIADPSGYVYEAVPSNRLEGVKAEIYEYTYAVDEFGIPADEKSEILWDAASYDQVNPQLTREDGTFGWDVPEGQWLVKFTKEGYEDADSRKDAAADKDGYLPVPPIQTEVNTAMVSKASPEVANVAAYPTEVQIDFTQYMQIDTVNTANVTVTADGSLVAGTIVPLNTEDNYEGTKQFASSFAYRFAGEVSGKLAISVKNAKNYSGRAMAAAFEKAETVAPMPKSLEITGATEIPHHGSRTLTVKVVPAEAGYGKTLRFKSYSPSIASANAETAVVGKSGTATFTVSGELPGQAIFEVSLEGTKLSEELEIAVTPEAAAVKSIEDYPVSLAEETLVYDGTEKTPAVTVTGLTEGTDYTAAYDSNINAGEASVTVTGAGAYTGTVTLTFTIAPADIDGAEVGALADATYTGKAKKPVPAVTFGGKTLISGTDYDISYENNVNVGEAKAVLTGKGNFTGTKWAAFVINKATQKLACKVSAIAVGEKATLAVTGMKGGTLTVTSSDKTVLKVVKTAQSTKKFQVQALKVGTVKLTIKAGTSDNYKSASLKVTVKVVPAATTKIAVTNLSKGLKVAWAKVTGATGYLVYCNNKLIKTITSGKTVSLTHTKANTNGTKYVYKIVATAATGQSTLSKSATAYRLAQPAISAAKNSAAGTLGLKWGKNAKATGYQIEYSTGKTFKTVKKVTVKKAATVTAKIAKLTKDKTYYVRLRAYKTVSGKTYFSAYSAAKAVKITK